VGLCAGQAIWPREQVWLQVPPLQTSPAGHTTPQAPQFMGSVASFVQKAEVPLPQAFGVAAGQEQVPFAQACPAGQTTPQPPQFAASVEVVAR